MQNYPSVNPELLGLAFRNASQFARHEKRAFVPGGDPSMAAGPGGGAPPGGDPMAGGVGMPPGGDPMAGGGMPPGGDPMAGGMPPGGGGPPPGGDPMAGGGGGGDPMAMIQQMIQQTVQQAMAAGGGGAAPGEAMIKPKIDVNIEIMQMKKILAKIADAMGINIPAADMVATPEDLTQMAQGGPGFAAADKSGPAGPSSSISPIAPMGAAAPGMGKAGADIRQQGRAFDSSKLDTSGLHSVGNKASAILSMRSRKTA